MSMKISINGETIPEGMCRNRIESLRQADRTQSEEKLREKAANDIIQHVLMKNEARKMFPKVPEEEVDTELARIKQQFRTEDEFQSMCTRSKITEDTIKEDVRNSIRINQFVQQMTKAIPPPPPHVMEEYYAKDSDISMRPPEIHASHIVKKPDPAAPQKTYHEMCSLRKQLLDGADFREIAEKHSSCRENSGDLGFFSQGKMVEEFEVVVFSMNKGEISPIFKTPFGYHIAKIHEIRPERRLSFDECRDEIKTIIMQKLTEQKLDEWTETERKKVKITISD